MEPTEKTVFGEVVENLLATRGIKLEDLEGHMDTSSFKRRMQVSTEHVSPHSMRTFADALGLGHDERRRLALAHVFEEESTS